MTLILKKKKKAVLPAAEEITTFPSLGLDCQEVSPRAEVRMVEAAGLSGEDAEIYEEVNPLVDVDFAMKFKYIRVEDFEGDAKAMEKATEMIRARKEVIRKIKKSAGLRILRRDSKALDEKGRKEAYFILVSAPAAMLVEEAERINMSKKLKAVFTDFESDAVGYEKFRAKDVHLFESSPGAGFFTSLERQRCIYAKLEASLVHGGAELDLDGMKEDGIIADWTFMPNMYEEDGLMKSWVTNYFSSAPVHEVRDYLGEKVGFYFAFLDHCASAQLRTWAESAHCCLPGRTHCSPARPRALSIACLAGLIPARLALRLTLRVGSCAAVFQTSTGCGRSPSSPLRRSHTRWCLPRAQAIGRQTTASSPSTPLLSASGPPL